MFHLVGMGFALAKHRSSKAMQVVIILKARLAEMRIMTILRRAEPVRFAASTLPVASTMAPAGVVGTSVTNNLSNNPTGISTDGVVSQLLNATISTTVPLFRTLTDVRDARLGILHGSRIQRGGTASLMQHVSIHNRFK